MRGSRLSHNIKWNGRRQGGERGQPSHTATSPASLTAYFSVRCFSPQHAFCRRLCQTSHHTGTRL